MFEYIIAQIIQYIGWFVEGLHLSDNWNKQKKCTWNLQVLICCPEMLNLFHEILKSKIIKAFSFSIFISSLKILMIVLHSLLNKVY